MGIITYLFLLTALCSCSLASRSENYQKFYGYLKKGSTFSSDISESDYFLVLIVDACHLDYSNNSALVKTIAKHPSDGSKSGDIGHAWIYLQGIQEGEKVIVEGGHTGEFGMLQPKYFDGVMNNIDFGYPDPSFYQKMNPGYEPNPIKYLWTIQRDGLFQEGGGGHSPTFAAKIHLTSEQFKTILSFIESYPYREYSLIGNQCCSFVTKIAALAGLNLKSDVMIEVDPTLRIGGETLPLWSDPCYSKLLISSPDILERSLMEAVEEGHAQYALEWYYKIHGCSLATKIRNIGETIRLFPERIRTYIKLSNPKNKSG